MKEKEERKVKEKKRREEREGREDKTNVKGSQMRGKARGK